MFLHLHYKYLNNFGIMLLPSETSYAWIGILVVGHGHGHGHGFTTFLLKMFD